MVNFVFMSLEDLCLAALIAMLSALVSLRSLGIQASTNSHSPAWNFRYVSLSLGRLIRLRIFAIVNTKLFGVSFIDRVPEEVLLQSCFENLPVVVALQDL